MRLTLGDLRRKLASRVVRAGRQPEPPPEPPDYVDPKAMISTMSVEDLRRTAEDYFSRLEHWDDHLRKPFTRIEETPQLLINFSVALQGLELAPGMKVLDFAAGTCWASRFMSQLGCEVIALDVSDSALKIGRELYRRLPLIGEQPEPEFLVFDGRHIDLPDASVDRIFCFDAFHHVPNQSEVLREMSRILVDGGIAAFAEPGPHHSRSPQSQFEMKTFNVLENDLDLREVWKLARSAGFTDLRVAVHHVSPFHLPLREFESFLDGGEESIVYLDFVRHFNRNVRDFFLYKGERGGGDSRRTVGLRGEIAIEIPRTHAAAGETIIGRAIVKNTGTATWLGSAKLVGGVSLGCHLYDTAGNVMNFDFYWARLSPDGERKIGPGESAEIALSVPSLAPGKYTLEFDLVSNRVCWFGQVQASAPVRMAIEVG